jgi:hypothetical protein
MNARLGTHAGRSRKRCSNDHHRSGQRAKTKRHKGNGDEFYVRGLPSMRIVSELFDQPTPEMVWLSFSRLDNRTSRARLSGFEQFDVSTM